MVYAMALLQFVSDNPHGSYDQMYVSKGGGLTKQKKLAARLPYNVAYAAMKEWNHMADVEMYIKLFKMDGHYEIVEVKR